MGPGVVETERVVLPGPPGSYSRGGVSATSPPACGESHAPKFPSVVGTRRVNYVAQGDSRTAGLYLDGGPDRAYPALAGILSGSGVVVTNRAVPGATVASMVAVDVDPLYNPGADANVLTIQIGVNDLRSKPSAPVVSSIESSLATYGGARLARGWRVYVVVDLPCAALEDEATWNEWVAFEESSPGSWSTGVIGSRGEFEQSLDPAWFVDGLHPSENKHVEEAVLVAGVLVAL